MENETKIVKRFTEKQNTESNNFSNDLVNMIFFDKDKKVIEIPVVSIRIIFNIMSILKSSQFQRYKLTQLKLFDDVFFTDTDSSYAQITVSNNVVNPGRNANMLKEALDYLTTISQWVTYTNPEGKELKAKRQFILDPTYDRGKTTFLMSNFWMYKLLDISNYNEVLEKLVYETSDDKIIIFYFWIAQLKDEGTTILIDNFKDKFKLNYSKNYDLKRSFLDIARDKFNSYGVDSFNYEIEGDKISFAKYKVKLIDKDTLKSPTNKINNEKRRKKHYLKTRHSLSDEAVKRLEIPMKYSFTWVMSAYELFISECKTNKTKVTDIKDFQFLEKLQDCIIRVWENSIQGKHFPNGYPKVI